MQKFSLLLLAVCLVLMVGSSSLAAVSAPSYDHSGAGDLDLTGKNHRNADVGASTTLKAYVTPYASVSFGVQQDKVGTGYSNTSSKGLVFSGVANEEKEGKIIYIIESNCDVNVDGFGSAFKGSKDGVLSTSYKLVPANDNGSANPGSNDGWRTIDTAGFVWAPEAYDHKYVQNSSTVYNVLFKATTGKRISAQRAGNYSATYIVTIWNPTNLND